MEDEDRALKNTEYAGMYWGLIYALTIINLLVRGASEWKAARIRPFDWMDGSLACMSFLYCLIPLLMGLVLRRTLRKEKDRELLSKRTYDICDFGIAQLLLFVYMGMIFFRK